MGRAQGIVLMLLAVALFGHLTLGGKGREIANGMTPGGDNAGTKQASDTTPTTAPATTPAPSLRGFV